MLVSDVPVSIFGARTSADIMVTQTEWCIRVLQLNDVSYLSAETEEKISSLMRQKACQVVSVYQQKYDTANT